MLASPKARWQLSRHLRLYFGWQIRHHPMGQVSLYRVKDCLLVIARPDRNTKAHSLTLDQEVTDSVARRSYDHFRVCSPLPPFFDDLYVPFHVWLEYRLFEDTTTSHP